MASKKLCSQCLRGFQMGPRASSKSNSCNSSNKRSYYSAIVSPISRTKLGPLQRAPEFTRSKSNIHGQHNLREYSQLRSWRPGGTTEVYASYGFTQRLFETCSSQANYKVPHVTQKNAEIPKTASGEDIGVGESWWYQNLGLLPTFSTWSQVTFLHMYLLTVRLRGCSSPETVRTHLRHLSDHYSHNAEMRMDVLHGISSRSIRNRYLKDLFIQWRGVLAAYDEGMARGDAVLAAAVWRNIWKAEPVGPDGKDVDWSKIATVVAYMRRVTHELSKVDELDLIFAVAGDHRGQPAIFGPRPSDLAVAMS